MSARPSHVPATPCDEDEVDTPVDSRVPHESLDQRNKPPGRDSLSAQLLIQAVVPHVAAVHTTLTACLTVFLPSLSIRSQVKRVREVETRLQEALDPFADGSQLVFLRGGLPLVVIVGGGRGCLEGDELYVLEFVDDALEERRLACGHSADFLSAYKNHQMLSAKDVQDTQEALYLYDPLGILPHYDIYPLKLRYKNTYHVPSSLVSFCR